jgi:predicted nucleotidyltransferase
MKKQDAAESILSRRIIRSRDGVESVRSAARRLAQATAAKRIVLFGSVARGEPDYTDVDFCCVLPDQADLKHVLSKAQNEFKTRLTPLDFIALHEEDYNRGSTVLAREIKKHGILAFQESRPSS